jgi:hypothetical protein
VSAPFAWQSSCSTNGFVLLCRLPSVARIDSLARDHGTNVGAQHSFGKHVASSMYCLVFAEHHCTTQHVYCPFTVDIHSLARDHGTDVGAQHSASRHVHSAAHTPAPVSRLEHLAVQAQQAVQTQQEVQSTGSACNRQQGCSLQIQTQVRHAPQPVRVPSTRLRLQVTCQSVAGSK